MHRSGFSEKLRPCLWRESQAIGFGIIPLLIEDADIPEVLQDRLWIDFRDGFDPGLSRLLGVIRRRTSQTDGKSGSSEDADYFLYYATEEGGG